MNLYSSWLKKESYQFILFNNKYMKLSLIVYLEEYIYIAIINIENASIIREQNNILEYGGQFKFSVGTNKYIYIYIK